MIADDLAKIPATHSVYCNRCRGDTRHECIWKSSREAVELDENGEPSFAEWWIYIGWRCLGCDSVALEERYSNILQEDDKGDGWDVTFHPERSRHKIKPKHFTTLPDRLAKIYQEALKAFNSEARVLTAIGLRSLIEGVCRDKRIEGGNLEKKIDGMARILPASTVKNLHSLRFMGNTATHDLDPPPTYELRLAIEVCEDLLNYLYELDYKAAGLGRLTSRRIEAKRSAVASQPAPPTSASVTSATDAASSVHL
jgi:hypothetical protein